MGVSFYGTGGLRGLGSAGSIIGGGTGTGTGNGGANGAGTNIGVVCCCGNNSSNTPTQNLTGTPYSPIILSKLEDGNYVISGTVYPTNASEEPENFNKVGLTAVTDSETGEKTLYYEYIKDNNIYAHFVIFKEDGTFVELDKIMTGENCECGEMAEQVQSNWNENDSESPAYIKNRPFYEGVDTAPLHTISLQEIKEDDNQVQNIPLTNEDIQSLLDSADDNMVLITLGDETKSLIMQKDDSSNVIRFYEKEVDEDGNHTLLLDLNTNILSIYHQDPLADTDLKIYSPADYYVKKIDEKFLPDSLYKTIENIQNMIPKMIIIEEDDEI